MELLEPFRKRVVGAAASPFGHAPFPLEHTLEYMGDPGLCGPGSATWEMMADVSSFIGGIRALIIQAAHPEVAAGVKDHSRYREDPLGRLSRTSNYVTASSFGAMPEVENAVSLVRQAHEHVRGKSHRGVAYTAGAPKFAAWVHNALTDGFLVAYETFGPKPLSIEDADRYVAEQSKVGRMLDADPIPMTAQELSDWIELHPDLDDSPGRKEAIQFLRWPPLPALTRVAYMIMFAAAAATVPRRIRKILGLHKVPGAITAGKVFIGFLRWAMGMSPAWMLALHRVGEPIPEGVFKQAPRVPIN